MSSSPQQPDQIDDGTRAGAPFTRIHGSLHKLIGYHRRLLDTVRMEKDALVQVELRAIRDTTCAKQALVESIRLEEAVRVRLVSELARQWKVPLSELSLNRIIIEAQGVDVRVAEQLRSTYNALAMLVKRVTEQNQENARFVERSLEHIDRMKRNVLGESGPGSQTYTQYGTKSPSGSGSRFISREA